VPANGAVDLHVWVDRSSVEVFANDGQRVITDQVFPRPDSGGLEVFARHGAVRLESLEVWPLESAISRSAPVPIPVTNETLRESVDSLRLLGSDWQKAFDPMAVLERIRHGGESEAY
jgi:hypothetical protein